MSDKSSADAIESRIAGPQDALQSINIRPGVSILSVLSHLNYKPWFAMAEFVDNALQSAIASHLRIAAVEGESWKLRVSIDVEARDDRITIRDNAAGINLENYSRAFQPAEVPVDRTGLSEFGMGMKSAACWFSKKWSVRTKALGEDWERTVVFDIKRIVGGREETINIHSIPAPTSRHYTEVILEQLHKPPQGNTVAKIKEHLASIYRIFLKRGQLEIRYNSDPIEYQEPAILVSPFYKTHEGPPISWRKDIAFDFGGGQHVSGFAALRETGSTSGAGFALFRRGRLIEGSGEDGYRPEAIFGKSNSFTYQRLFGGLHLSGFDVSYTKDGFRWDENEEPFLELLKEHINAQPLPLIDQAEGYRARPRSGDYKAGAEAASKRTAEAIVREVPPVLEQLEAAQPQDAPPEDLPPVLTAAQRTIDVDLGGESWRIVLELSDDPALGDWLSLYDAPQSEAMPGSRLLGVRLALLHPFMDRYGGTDASRIEPILRIAAAIALGETAARDSGVKMAGTVRRNINELLRFALSKP